MLFHIPINADTVSLICLGASAVTAVIYLKRLLVGLALGCRPKCTYHALWAVPYGTSLAYIVLCDKISWDCSPLICTLWIFVLICAIIHSGFPIKKAKNQEAVMRDIIGTIDSLKQKISWVGRFHFFVSKKLEKHRSIPFCIRVGLEIVLTLALIAALMVFATILFAPAWLSPELQWPYNMLFLCLIYYLIFLTFALYWCARSCILLIIFWLSHVILTIIALTHIPENMIFIRVIDRDFSLYCISCIVATAFWCLSAGVADYDVAKMAGSIVNTFTTIFLIAVNIVFGWLQQEAQSISPAFSEEAIYIMNFAIFPFVVAGYLAVLFADGIDYWRRRCAPPPPRAEETEDSGE